MILRDCADFYSRFANYGLAFLLLVLPLLSSRRIQQPKGKFWCLCLLSIGVAVGLAKLGKAILVWPMHPSFPSGHTAFSAAAMTLLTLHFGARWLLPSFLAVALMGFSLVYGGWHSRIDVLGGALLGFLISLLFYSIMFFRHSSPASKPEKQDG